MTNPRPKELMNKTGKMIPAENVRLDHWKKHLLVEEVFTAVMDLNERMTKIKEKLYRKIWQYEKWLVKFNEVDQEVDFQNLTLTNYSGTKKIVIETGTLAVEFDENIQVAKVLIDKCIASWGKESHHNIKIIIDKAFRVGTKGMISKNDVLGLLQYKILDKDWKQAMDLITKSIVEKVKKEYIKFQYRENNKAGWKTLNLNFSSIELD